jgi:membrane-associated protein
MEESVLALAGSPWLLLAVWALTTIDGVLPPVPSESVVIAVAVLSTTGDGPPLYQLVPVAALGAFCGDLLAYTIGTRLPLRRLRIFRSARGQALLDWAEAKLRVRGSSFILTARFVPIGRVAVNMTAGAMSFPARRFVPTAALAASLWATYSTLLGAGAGAVLHEQPLLGVVVGIALGLLVGAGVDSAVARRARRAHAGEGPDTVAG